MEFADGEAIRHAEVFGAVVEVGEDVEVFSCEGLGEGWLVHAVEGAGGQWTFGFFMEDCFGEGSTLGGEGIGGTVHDYGLVAFQGM